MFERRPVLPGLGDEMLDAGVLCLGHGKPVEAIERSLSVLNMLQWRHELEWQNRPHRHRINIAVG